MDLKEYQEFKGVRHPWEMARIEAVRKVLGPHLRQGMKILDMGCGDGFVVRRLFSDLEGGEVTGVDINLTDDRISELQGLPGRIRYLKAAPADELFDLLLVMDVIEHVEDDYGFLASVVQRHVAHGGKVLITVPSFQALFGRHDVLLGHYRRYRLKGLEDVATGSRLGVLASGYLFGSLLLPKLLYNKLCELRSSSAGVGGWCGGRTVTSLIEGALNVDNSLLLAAAERGVKVPGLSAWALCEKL